MGRRFYRRPRARLWFAGVLFALVCVRWYQESRVRSAPSLLEEGVCEVEYVIDGDTIRLTNGARVRLIGVDTPEVHFPDEPQRPAEPWAEEARRYTEDFLAAGSPRLEFDHERKDRFERFLAYVWVDDRLLNESLIRNGLGRARLEFYYSDSRKRLFRHAQDAARDQRIGIWGDD
ncbi:MAG: thermonuclease family protein [Planctomycetales bacterium]|nr:thermonuclease family protein [Planctomycetales bacterium]